MKFNEKCTYCGKTFEFNMTRTELKERHGNLECPNCGSTFCAFSVCKTASCWTEKENCFR